MPFQQTMTVEERFWGHVSIGDGCWEWKLTPLPSGYGRFALSRRKSVRAHRMAWEMKHGDIPDGLCVLHECDNPICVRPGHLFLGTHGDNAADRDQKGRHWTPCGEAHKSAKLTRVEVLAIRAAREAGFRLREIAEKFGTTESNIWRITARVSWKHV